MSAQETLRHRYNWKKVEVPKTWNPKEPEELVGFYAGRTKRYGSYGQYEVVLVVVPQLGMRMVSGTQIIQLLDAALIEVGQPVRVVFNGIIPLKNDRTMKSFDLFVTEGDPIPREEMPQVEDVS